VRLHPETAFVTSTGGVDRIDHVVVAVRDVAVAAPSMARLLGAAPSWEGLQPADGTANALFRLANTTVELLGPSGRGPIGQALHERFERSGEGLLRIDFGTRDLEAVRARLANAGLEPPEAEDGLLHDDPSGAWRRFRVLDVPADANRGVWTRIVEDAPGEEIVPFSRPMHGDGSCVERLDHVVVMTRAPEHALAFYGDALGLRLALDRTFEKRGVRLIFFRTGGLTLEIGSSLEGDVGDLGRADRDEDRLWGVAHQVGDADLARRRLAQAGFETSHVRDGHKPGTRVFTVVDAPFGIPTLFIEPTHDGGATR
jgi:catechol 2,3-dioxygenase-like lactoylglutathione lyase family enzyme